MKEERHRIVGYPIAVEKFKEKDAIVTFLTAERCLTLKVPGGYLPTGKNHQATLVFNKAEIEAGSYNDKYLSVRSVATLMSNTSLYESLIKTTLLNFEREIIIKMFTDDDPLPYMWFEKSIELMKDNFDVLSMASIFLAQSLTLIGSQPMTTACNMCGRTKGIVHFSMAQGGFICHTCARENDLSFDDPLFLKTVRYVFNVTLDEVGAKKIPDKYARLTLSCLLSYIDESFNLKIRTSDMLLSAI